MTAVAFTAPINGLTYRSVAIFDACLVVALLQLLGHDGLRRGSAPRLPRLFCIGAALALLGGLIGTVHAPHPLASLPNLGRLFLNAVPIIVIGRWAPSLEEIRRYMWAWVAGASLSAVWALLSTGDAAGRAMGLTTHPNHLGMITSLGAGLALALAFSESGRLQALAASSFGIQVLAVLRSGSRAGLIACALTASVVLMRTRHANPSCEHAVGSGRVYVGSAIAGTILIATRFVSLGDHNSFSRLVGDQTSVASDRVRVQFLREGLRAIARNPVTGGGFEHVLQAHNIYIQVWSAAGLIGLAGLLLIASAVVRTGWQIRQDDARGAMATAFVAGYVGYLAAATTQNFVWDRYLWLHAGVILYLGGLTSNRLCDLKIE